jgi:hypothetical protein
MNIKAMDTKTGLIKFGLGEMSGPEVVSCCPRLAEVSEAGAKQCAQNNASPQDRETVRAFEALLSLLGPAPLLESGPDTAVVPKEIPL